MSNGAHDARSLDRPTSLSLLSSVGVGRVGLSVDALPVIMPVGFRVVGDRIVFALPAGRGAAGAVNGTVVAFEADGVDAASGVGWTVLVQGPARLVTDLLGSAGDRWGSSPDSDGGAAFREQRMRNVVSVSTEVITGWLTDIGVRGTSTSVTSSPV